MKCPICSKESKRLFAHLKRTNDEQHQKLFNAQITLIIKLFENLDVNKDSNLLDFNILFNYDQCLKAWQGFYGKEKCRLRANKLNGMSVSKALKGVPKSKEHKESLSKSHVGQVPWNKGLNVNNSEKIRKAQDKRNATMSQILKEKYRIGEMKPWLSGQTKENNPKLKIMYEKIAKALVGKNQSSYGLSGKRKDIGHGAMSTYEANVYRILQYHGGKYLMEYDNIKEITMPNGDKRYYRIDMKDLDGVFGIKGAYIEVKGYCDDADRLKMRMFKEQYPQEKLLLIGRGDKRTRYYWEPDINYTDLEKQYKTLIPLWEDRKQNIKTHPHLYKGEINNEINI